MKGVVNECNITSLNLQKCSLVTVWITHNMSLLTGTVITGKITQVFYTRSKCVTEFLVL